MHARDAIKLQIQTARLIVDLFLADLTDAELLIRPVPQSNHVAWQLGHLIVSEHRTLALLNAASPLPDEFTIRHFKPAAACDDPRQFCTKADYQARLHALMDAACAAADTLSVADLDEPGPEAIRKYAPTVGAALVMVGVHILMHVGQIAVLRRKLGKPIVM